MNKNSNTKRYKKFCITPKQLFDMPKYKKMSSDAKLLYTLMLDRASLSEKNGWRDDNGSVYIIYTLREVSETLHCGHDKAIKLLRELDTEHGAGLIYRKKMGNGKRDYIYVYSPDDVEKAVEKTVESHVDKVWKPDLRLKRAVEIYERMLSEKPIQTV